MLKKAARGSGWDRPAPLGSVLCKLAKEGESVKDTFLRFVLPKGPDSLSKHGIEMEPAGIKYLARKMEIQDHGGTLMVPWEPYEEQEALWDALCGEDSVNILKPRQTGISTAGDWYDTLWTALQDCLGGQVTCALIWDTRKKAKEQISKCASFASQLGLPLSESTKESITFTGGSRVEAYTAGALGGARSLSFQRVHASEVPWWQGASETWAALQPSLGLGASDLIETTMEMSGEPLAADLWRKDNSRFKLFFSFEQHSTYRMDPDRGPGELSEEDEEWLRNEGFTDRWSMAWWIWRLRNKMNGDIHRMFREYPQLERHAFSLAAGRWVRANPKVVPALWTMDVESGQGDGVWTVDWWAQIEETSMQHVIIVDTAHGVGGDRSVVTVLDKASDSIIAHFADNFCHRDDLALVAVAVQIKLQRQVQYLRKNKKQRWLPDIPIVVETNGPGGYTYESIVAEGGWAIPWQTGSENDATSYACLLAAKRGVEHGRYYGPKVLEEECDRLHRKVHADGRTGPWVGPKDTLMTLGIGSLWIEKNPFVSEPTRADELRDQAEARDRALRAEEDRPEKGRGSW
jgi:hypothetical protein